MKKRLKHNAKNTKNLHLKNIIKDWDGINKIDVSIIGIPFDHGVRLSGGRVGAAKAPDVIRQQLIKYGTVNNIARDTDLANLKIADLGNVDTSHNAHDTISDATAKALSFSDVAITLGGGNDISYATIKALSKSANNNIGGANIDAHLDVRPVVNGCISSGTPYRKLIDENFIDGKYFSEIAIQGHLNLKSHRDWLVTKKSQIIFLDEVKRNGAAKVFTKFIKQTKKCKWLFVSIDIDSVAQAFAPASSAPSPDGLFPADILAFAFLAGKNPKVRLFEIMELNPKYDTDNKTSRLTANIILEFLAGYSKRK